MSYETGSAGTREILLDKLRLFAIANGWNQTAYGPRTQGVAGQALHLEKEGYRVGILTGGSGNGNNWTLFMYPNPYAPPLDSEPNQSENMGTKYMFPPFVAYHFFADRTYIHIVVEVSPGLFQHISFGKLNTEGLGGLGHYMTASNWSDDSGHISNPDGSSNRWLFEAYGSQTYVRYDIGNVIRYIRWGTGLWGGVTDYGSYSTQALHQLSLSAMTGRASLVPILLGATHTSGTANILIGTPYDCRRTNMVNLNPGEIITLGSDSWMVFPERRKNGAAGTENSGNWGLAYRRT